jgi:RimJ/RimL family protein N-acetyltransferase
MPIMPPDPPLSDGVVTLRPWREADASAIAEACRDAEIVRWLDQVPQPYTRADAREYIAAMAQNWREGTAASFAIADAATGDVVGSITVHWVDAEQGVAEVGYWVAPRARGRGVAPRAVRLVGGWAIRECGVERLQLRADVRNESSRRVAVKAGFHEEGVHRSIRFSPRHGHRVDYVMYSLLPDEVE